MKNKFLKILSKPKIIIPVFIILGILVIAVGYKYVGNPPTVEIKNDNLLSTIKSEEVIDLSFSKSGRLESVLVEAGQEVKKGEILAKLSAPDALGTVSQTKGALDLAEAQYASLNSQYKTTQKQQDLIVQNALQTLLSNGLEADPSKQTSNSAEISGTYACQKEGFYKIKIYKSSDNDTGYSLKYSGLENGTASVKYENPVSLGSCGLQIKWKNVSGFNTTIDWVIEIPNTKSSVYLANKNAYDLATANREKTLSDLATTIGDENEEISVAKAGVNAARGAYEAALGAYQNYLIIAPNDGVVTFVDLNLKVGQSVSLNKPVISITVK